MRPPYAPRRTRETDYTPLLSLSGPLVDSRSLWIMLGGTARVDTDRVNTPVTNRAVRLRSIRNRSAGRGGGEGRLEAVEISHPRRA